MKLSTILGIDPFTFSPGGEVLPQDVIQKFWGLVQKLDLSVEKDTRGAYYAKDKSGGIELFHNVFYWVPV